jgi:hypothetical protein
MAVSERVSPEGWNRGEYADAENVLSGWRAGVCRHVGVCGNWFSAGGESGEESSVVGEMKRIKAPDFVLGYGEYFTYLPDGWGTDGPGQRHMFIYIARRSLCPAISASSKAPAPPPPVVPSPNQG